MSNLIINYDHDGFQYSNHVCSGSGVCILHGLLRWEETSEECELENDVRGRHPPSYAF